MTFHATILTLYPEMFPGPLGVSLAGRARDEGKWTLDTVQIRDFAIDKHKTVDDTPAGGGAGMVLRVDVLAAAIDFARSLYLPGTGWGTSAAGGGGSPQRAAFAESPRHHPADGPPPRAGEERPIIAMTPRGKPLTQARVRELAAGPGVIVLCGRFEGYDERIFAARGVEEVSLGDIVLSGGEVPALMLLDACIRLLPGVMGAASSGAEESFENGLLEYPHYTRPAMWEGRTIPEVLRSGDHAKIAGWRKGQSEIDTRLRRPDLWERHTGARVQSASGARQEDEDPGQ
ncbi:tRNA (guanosine(37)-N1)-methyltransferase TrmD [Novosphingobium sp.]|uniref:tRNA (guanosine(37)-N1)-methyltransferase TrmD n=1 Tax=Novosphingobium sp. TaxID=1874826 RepID=UPI00286B697C|nr:tRNA (guanosine(37)-N1)-methyltransferase TrmD [Novosphingobium sp.]